MLAFLSVELGVLPSQLLKEDYNLVSNIISVIQSKNQAAEREASKHKR